MAGSDTGDVRHGGRADGAEHESATELALVVELLVDFRTDGGLSLRRRRHVQRC